MVNTRIAQMIAKPKHWKEAFRLSTTILCASSTEHFATSWHSVATSLQAKLKDRQSRECALQAICRLVWTYLARINEPSATVIRKLEDVVKVILPSGKKSYLSNDPTFSEPIIEIIRIMGSRHREFCFRNIIFPLISSDLFVSGKDTRIEQLEPEKMVIGIKAFLKILADLEKSEHGLPPFPRFAAGGLAIDSHTVPGVWYSSQPSGGFNSTLAEDNDVNDDDDQLSRPVNTSKLDDSTKEFYGRFCEILGKITLICDNAFGGQVVLDEKFGALTPKTPLTDTFTFSRKDEHVGLAEQRQGFYELFHVAVQALPRCLSVHIQLKSLINLLCTGTAHVSTNIALSSTNSLKSIARQSLAQPVTIGFARFIFNFDARYSTMSDDGMLGPGHIESTLRLYVELLQIWIEEIKRKSREAAIETTDDGSTGSRGIQLDLTSVEALVEEVESHGIFFLCSQSRRVRSFAVKVLKLVTEFDVALGRERSRIIHILEGDSQRVMDINDEQLTVAERSRLQKGKRRSAESNTLIELCSSDVSYDATLWLKLFPNIVRLSFELCALAVTLGRDIVCARLLQMHESITKIADTRGPHTLGISHQTAHSGRFGTAPPEILVEQWKLYLIMACTTMTNAGAQTQSQLDKTQHARKISRGIQQGQEKISSARQLFANMIPLLQAGQSSIRDAIVIALGSININLYRTLLESLQYAVTTCKEEAKQRIGAHQRTGSNPRRNSNTDRLRTEVAQVYRLTARFLHEATVLKDDWILNNLSIYTKDLMIFLNDAEIQNDWECQKLRRQYCGLLEELFDGINRTADPSRYMAFESRKSAFALMEDWCGYSPNQSQIAQREDNWQTALEHQQDTREKTNVTAAMEIEKRNLKIAALSAMAALCITTKASGALHNEVQALWQALATGPHAGNVQLILDFVINLCLDRREQSFVDYAKQIIVFLSSTPAGQKVVEFLLMQINARNMVQKQREPTVIPPDQLGLPYVADLSEALPIGNKQDQAREMLVHLIHELVITKIEDNSTTPNKQTIETFVESIRQREANVIWTYEEHNGKDDIDDSTRVPASMSYVTAQVVDLFTIAYPQIQEQWARTCLNWATSCPTIIGALEPTDLLQYPLLFWATCACLETVYEQEFGETLGMLERLLEKVNLGDPAVVRLLENAKPEKWRGSFEGIAPLVYKGLKSGLSLGKSLQIMDQIVALPDSDLVGNHTRLLFGTLANLPCFLESFSDATSRAQCIQSALVLANVAESQGKRDIAVLLKAFSDRKTSCSVEFLNQMLSTLRQAFFPTWELKTLTFLIGLLTNRLPWYKDKTLEVLLAVIRDVDTRRTEITSHGPDLISPLLRLLQTPYCTKALEVMDLIRTMSETPMSEHHMRMSFIGSTSRSTRKQYDKTQSLYGIPELTGWSIPMPAIHTENTRVNMQAVYLACIQADSMEAEAIHTPEIEFHADEEHQSSSYFPLEHSNTSTVVEDFRAGSVMEGGMGDLLTKLNSLDDFFDDSFDLDDDTPDHYSVRTMIPYNNYSDSRADIYDQQTAPILHKSLGRTASVSSLHNGNGYEDLRAPPSSMTPTAFLPSSANSVAPQPSRPSLHARSVTSPANNLTKTSNGLSELLSDNETEETLSEGERSTGYSGSRLTGDTSLRNAQSSIRKMAPGLEGKDYRQRGLLRAQSRSRSQAPGSPSVPKVPEAYLQQQQQPPPGLRPSDTF
ncbi:hypothetical protein P7C71_g582, partial [Lecanoromycetidae sp. Uapishka_2]